MKEKTFEVPVSFRFAGVFIIKAKDAATAKEYAEKHCGMTTVSGVHSSLPDETVDWHFPCHPDKVIGRPKKV